MTKLRVAIVGCGSAGPAAAILLARRGHDVSLFERAPVCLPVGAGFLLQPTGMKVLQELGIEEAVITRGSRIDRLHAITRSGSLLMDLRYADLHPHMYGLGLHRPILLDSLTEAMQRAGVETHWGWDVAGLKRDENSRSTLIAGDGRESGPWDLLVIADGARSTLRGLAGFRGINRSYPWGAHWFIGANPGTLPENELFQVVDGTRRLTGFMPTGIDEHGRPLTSLFWSVRLDQDEAQRRLPLETWKDAIIAQHPPAAQFLDQIHDWSQILTARYGDVRMHHWHGERTAILGDAAHAMSPQLGQGVNLALADASCLARCIEMHPLDEALWHYSRERRLALLYYQLSTRWLTPFFQSDHDWLAPARDTFFSLSQLIPIARRQMVRTMAGGIGSKGGFV